MCRVGMNGSEQHSVHLGRWFRVGHGGAYDVDPCGGITVWDPV